MYRALRIFTLVAGSFGALLLAVYAYGIGQPLEHTARASITLPAPPAVVWAAVTDYSSMPAWWPEVRSITEETRSDGVRITWNEDSHGNKIGFVTKQEAREKLLVREILSEGQPFGGTWTYELSPAGDGTLLTITEKGFITPPVFRAVARMRGLDSTMKSYLAALETHLKTRR